MLVKVTDLENNEVWVDPEAVRRVVVYRGQETAEVVMEDGCVVVTNDRQVVDRINREL